MKITDGLEDMSVLISSAGITALASGFITLEAFKKSDANHIVRRREAKVFL